MNRSPVLWFAVVILEAVATAVAVVMAVAAHHTEVAMARGEHVFSAQ